MVLLLSKHLGQRAVLDLLRTDTIISSPDICTSTTRNPGTLRRDMILLSISGRYNLLSNYVLPLFCAQLKRDLTPIKIIHPEKNENRKNLFPAKLSEKDILLRIVKGISNKTHLSHPPLFCRYIIVLKPTQIPQTPHKNPSSLQQI